MKYKVVGTYRYEIIVDTESWNFQEFAKSWRVNKNDAVEVKVREYAKKELGYQIIDDDGNSTVTPCSFDWEVANGEVERLARIEAEAKEVLDIWISRRDILREKANPVVMTGADFDGLGRALTGCRAPSRHAEKAKIAELQAEVGRLRGVLEGYYTEHNSRGSEGPCYCERCRGARAALAVKGKEG